MWNQACSPTPAGTSSRGADLKRAFIQILPCTVSQLLSASQDRDGSFSIGNLELNQLSVVGIIRGYAPFVTNVQYRLDDMTGPPLNVKQWVNSDDGSLVNFAAPGSYVKVIGSLRDFGGQRSLLAMDIRRIKDLNEITSHMMEEYDVNMNITAASQSGKPWSKRGDGEYPKAVLPNGLSTIQAQVLEVIRKFSVPVEGISLFSLEKRLEYISVRDIRTSLSFLINEGHIFTTTDDHHFMASV